MKVFSITIRFHRVALMYVCIMYHLCTVHIILTFAMSSCLENACFNFR